LRSACSLSAVAVALGIAPHDFHLVPGRHRIFRFALLIVDEVGYLPSFPGDANLFFQLVNAHYEKAPLS
jgi:hypothetical protein